MKGVFCSADEKYYVKEFIKKNQTHLAFCNMVYVFCKKNNGVPYIKIWVIQGTSSDGEYVFDSFEFAKNRPLPEVEEWEMISFLKANRTKIDEVNFSVFQKKVKECFDEIHLESYENWRHVLFHVYYALHASGIRELLYKANLNYIADKVDELPCYNLLADSIKDYFGLPLGLLRALNSNVGCRILMQETPETLKKIFETYHNLIHRYGVKNMYQWDYLKQEAENNRKIIKGKYLHYGKLGNEYEYTKYLEYEKLREEYSEYLNLSPYVVGQELDDALKETKQIRSVLCEESRLIMDPLIKRKAESNQSYVYEGEDYVVYPPSCVHEMALEAKALNHCLLSYVIMVAKKKETLILFMRKAKCPEKSLVTIEIDLKSRAALQARGRFNRKLFPEEELFLDEYLKKNNLRNTTSSLDELIFA